MQKGDVITKVAGVEVKNVNELNREKNTHNIGETISLSIFRNGETIEVNVTLEETPAKQETSATNEEIEDSLFNRNNSNTPKNNGSIFDFFNW